MATDDKNDEQTTEDPSSDAAARAASLEEAKEKLAALSAGQLPDDHDEEGTGQLGVLRFVLAGFFAAAVGVAFVLGKALAMIWGRLADARWFQNSMAALAAIGEEERAEICTVVGAVIGIGGAIYAYRRADVRQWTDEVASELSKVTWPDKAEVTTSTVVVIVTSAAATVYLALLDRFWGFVTGLVYGGS